MSWKNPVGRLVVARLSGRSAVDRPEQTPIPDLFGNRRTSLWIASSSSSVIRACSQMPSVSTDRAATGPLTVSAQGSHSRLFLYATLLFRR